MLLPLIAAVAATAAAPPAHALEGIPPARAVSVAAEPTDPLVPLEWWRPVVGADRATPPGPGKPVTVVDSGLDISHEEFAHRPNTTLLNPQTVRAANDDHGTEVSSVVAAPENGVGIVGVYPQADLRSWDASPAGALVDDAAIQGILEAARRGPGVINLSFGGPVDDPRLEEAILVAVRRGSLVVAASGNEGDEGSPDNFPANYAHVLTVGATAPDGGIADFSTASPFVDLVAPGVSIPLAEPGNTYVRESGTSFSSPLVAGAAAWVWTARPELDNTQLFEVMRRSARDVAPRGPDPASGYGILDIPAALGFAAPVRDPSEPNDKPEQIEAGALFAAATPPLTTPSRRSASIVARVDRHEDPNDLYRVYVPAGGRATASTRNGAVDLRLFRRTVRALRTTPLARSVHVGTRAETATYRNRGARGVYVYADVRAGSGVLTTTYTLRVTTAARR